jgi:hypothetical protein
MGIPVRLQTIKSFRMRGRRGGNSIGFSLTCRIRSLHHCSIFCVANFGFDRTLEIMMLVWLYLRSPPR